MFELWYGYDSGNMRDRGPLDLIPYTLPPLYLKTQARVHLIPYRTQTPIKSSTESRAVLILQILQKT